MKPAYRKSKSRSSLKRNTRNKSGNTVQKAKVKFSKFFAIFLLALLSILVFSGYSLYKYFNENFAWALENTSFDYRDGANTSFVYLTVDKTNLESPVISRLYFIIADINANKLLIHNIDPAMKVDIPGRFGEESLSNIVRFAILDNKDYMSSVSAAVLKLFKFHVEYYIETTPSYQSDLDEVLLAGGYGTFYNPVQLANLKKNVSTDVKLKDLFNISKFASLLPEDRKQIENVSSVEQINDDYSEFNFESVLNLDRQSIAVVNSTSKEGFATLAAEIIENHGGRVVGITSADKRFDDSFIVSNEPNSPTVTFLSRVFHISEVRSKASSQELNLSEIDRSDVVLVLGFDTAEWLY